MSQKLELIATPEGAWHVLDGDALREGDLVEIQLKDGSWLAGEYTWSGQRARWPVLRIGIATTDGGPHSVPVVLHPDCVLRRRVR